MAVDRSRSRNTELIYNIGQEKKLKILDILIQFYLLGYDALQSTVMSQIRQIFVATATLRGVKLLTYLKFVLVT
jgi:hypothetical protein